MSLSQADSYTTDILLPHTIDYSRNNCSRNSLTNKQKYQLGQAEARSFFIERIVTCEKCHNLKHARYMLSSSIRGVQKNLNKLLNHEPIICAPKETLEGMLDEYKKIFTILME